MANYKATYMHLYMYMYIYMYITYTCRYLSLKTRGILYCTES